MTTPDAPDAPNPSRRPLMRSVVASLFELAGIAVLVVAGWWLTPWVGMAVLGVGILVVARAIDPTSDDDFDLTDLEEPPPDKIAEPGGLDWGIS